jgi:uncharacterized protein (TIGR00251 family)
LKLTVHVKPGSKKGPLVIVESETELTVFLRERAVEGAANTGLIDLLARHFKVSKSKIEIEQGHSSRIKRVRVGL